MVAACSCSPRLAEDSGHIHSLPVAHFARLAVEVIVVVAQSRHAEVLGDGVAESSLAVPHMPVAACWRRWCSTGVV